MSIVAKKNNIYLDNAASTPIDLRVKKVMSKAGNFYGNPSSFNDIGRIAAENLKESRLVIAKFLSAHPDEVVFTSSGSEANSFAIQGIARNFQFSIFNFKKTYKIQETRFKPHIVTTRIEHPSVLKMVKHLEKEGFDATYLSVDKEGFINIGELGKSLRPETILVSVMYANNEIGTIQPIAEVFKAIKNFRNENMEISRYKNISLYEKFPIFHTDACQAAEYLDMNVNNLGVDLLTFNGAKIYGPKGVAVLYKKRGIGLAPLIYGGDQEYGLRAGTENLPAIAGLAKALSLVDKRGGARVSKLRDYLLFKIKRIIPEVMINGPGGEKRLPNNINISIPNLDSENLLLELDKYGICASSGSACMARSL